MYKLYLTGLGFKTFILLSWNHSMVFYVYHMGAALDQRCIPTRLPPYLPWVPRVRRICRVCALQVQNSGKIPVKEKLVSCSYLQLVFHVSCDVTKSGVFSIIKTFLLAPLYLAWQKQEKVSDRCWWNEISGYRAEIFGKDTSKSRIYCLCEKGI